MRYEFQKVNQHLCMGNLFSREEVDNQPRVCDPDNVFQSISRSRWYEVSKDYWSSQENSINGMLGGYPELGPIDIEFSSKILEKYIHKFQTKNETCADVGSGIGRISIELLSKHFQSITLVEPINEFIKKAEFDLSQLNPTLSIDSFCGGAQDWKITKEYDCIWVQWVIMFLRDEDAISFLKRCKKHLKPNGFIAIKDNFSLSEKSASRNLAFYFPDDNSFSRTYQHYVSLVQESGLEIVETYLQPNWPEDILPVYLFICK